MRSHPRRSKQLFIGGAAAVPGSRVARGAGPGGRAGRAAQAGQAALAQPQPAAAPSMRLPGRRDRLSGCRGEGGSGKAGRGQRERGEGREGGREV